MSDIPRILRDMERSISKKIARYAKRNGISYKEAEKRAIFKINGVEIKPLDANEISFLGDLSLIEKEEE